MGLREKILEEIFSKGLNKASSKDLKYVFKDPSKIHYRYETEPARLITKGWEPNYVREEGVGVPFSEPKGVYFSDPQHKNNYDDMGAFLQGLIRPGSKIYPLTPKKYNKLYGSTEQAIKNQDWDLGNRETQKLIDKGYDFIKYYSYKYPKVKDYDLVQLKPNNMLLKYSPDESKTFYKILSILPILKAFDTE